MPTPATRSPAPARLALGLLAASVSGLGGCTWISYLGTDPTGSQFGRTYYLGGAGPFGHVGTIDVPTGLREAGYTGSIEVFGWQSIVGGTLRDQMDRARNAKEARRLARRIQAYLRRYPNRRVNIIALSAGTGIATWALEALPPRVHVNNLVFLASSLSRDYDLAPALRRIDGKVYNFYSPDDPILRLGVPIAGSIDRETRGPDLAGVLGFEVPRNATPGVALLYREHLRNRPYRAEYREYGYKGLHADSTSVNFVRYVLTPLIMRNPATPELAEPAEPVSTPTGRADSPR